MRFPQFRGEPVLPQASMMELPMSQFPENWKKVPADEISDAIVASMALGGVKYLFFTSGSDIMFFQEALAKAKEKGLEAPKLIVMTHEHANLNAALGYAAVTGRPAASAVHVDVGTQHYGCALHTAHWAELPVLIMAGAPPTAYNGSMRGGRDGAHFWLQETLDQNGIARPYVKWDHRLEFQDNAGLIVSRALQVAQSQPAGAVYLSLPREIAFHKCDGATFPTAEQLGISRPSSPDANGICELAQRLVNARNPLVIISRSGRNPETIPALVELCELLAIPVVEGSNRAYQCFPYNHPLYQSDELYKGNLSLADVDVACVIDVDVPWMHGKGPGPDAFIGVIGVDSIATKIPTFDFEANLRINSDPLKAITALRDAVKQLELPSERIKQRYSKWADTTSRRKEEFKKQAQASAEKNPIDPAWLGYQICEAMDDNCIIVDDTMPTNPLVRYLKNSRPGSYFRNPGSGGGWAPGAALGVKLGAPERDVIAVSGDGFYMFSSSTSAIWAAKHYNAPFMTVIFQNRSWHTGTHATAKYYPDGYSVRGGLDGGYFDPPMDFAKEAEAAGAHAENVRDPAEIGPALRRGLEKIRAGVPAFISVWLPRHLQES
jgi:acetolactate synthase-1/2/3 large subunit